MYNERLTEALAVLAQLAPANQTAAAHAVGPFSIAEFGRVIFLINVGVLGSSATVDFKVQASATSGGTYADVSGTSITQITSGATNFVTVEVTREALMASSQGPYIKGVLTVGTAASQAGVVALGAEPRYGPASDFNVVTPTQQLVA